MPNMNSNNRKSPVKQQRIKHSHSIPVANTNSGRMRSTSSMASSYPRMYNNNSNHHHYGYHHYSNTTSPTAMSASSLPAVPLFYSNTYADPPECSSLPQPPESWYLPTNVDIRPVQVEEEKSHKQDKDISSTINVKSFSSSSLQASKQTIPRTCYYTSNNQGFYSPYYSSSTSSSSSTSPGTTSTAAYQKFPTQYISVKA